MTGSGYIPCSLHGGLKVLDTEKCIQACRYSDLASFMRGAPADQQLRLWHEVGTQVHYQLRVSAPDTPLWLSTEGSGVPWLHVRLDSRPKYIKHDAYRHVPSRASRQKPS